MIQPPAEDIPDARKPRRRLSRFLAPALVVLSLAWAVGAFAILMGRTGIVPSEDVTLLVLLGCGAAGLLLLVVIAREVLGILRERARGRAAARLLVRIVGLFTVIAVAPTVVVAIVASLTLDSSLDRYFSQQTQNIVATAGTVAQTYVREHALSIRGDALAMATDISRLRALYDSDPQKFQQIFTAQAALRNVPGAQIIKRDLTSLLRANLPTEREYLVPANIAVNESTTEQPIIYLAPDADFVGAVVPLTGFDDLFLYLARPIDPRVLGFLKVTHDTRVDYHNLAERRYQVQLAFALMYALITLIVLLSAVWLAINFSKWLVAPIRRLMWAADRVGTGNLDVRVPIHRSEGDLATLGETFNNMTSELKAQRNDIVSARDQIDSRRRFTEAVLAGVGAGVIGLDADERVTILNRSAERLLGLSEAEALGRKLAEVVPETAELIAEAEGAGQRIVQGNITIVRDGKERVFAMRVTTEQSSEAEHGWVATLDDITALITAQRTSAWADVARRIAHEIKNPLTPIQLSAERLKRKYGRHITQDRDVFDQCTDTIIRQVGDIGRMVDEFSSFARMPKPVVDSQDLAESIRQAVFLMRVGHPAVTFETDLPSALPGRYDRRLISQALTNVLKNAAEAIDGIPENERGEPRIKVKAAQVEEDLIIDVIDNGMGLPQDKRNRLLEPYVTTREKGTGLGLAIVGKIMEEHGGSIELNDSPEGRGAWIRLRLRVDGQPATGGAPTPAVPSPPVSGRA